MGVAGVIRAGLVVLLLSAPARALELQPQLSPSDRTMLLLRGEFQAGDADKLEAMLRRIRDLDFILFDSPGGDAEEGLRVGRVIRRAGASTHLAPNLACASACTYAFLGGRVRTMEPGARYGVHMFSIANNEAEMQRLAATIRRGGPAAAAEVVRLVEESSARFAAQLAYYAVEMGVSLRLLEPNFTTENTAIRWLSAEELRSTNVVNAD